jgi:Fe-Mn family superoxide dismutase
MRSQRKSEPSAAPQSQRAEDERPDRVIRGPTQVGPQQLNPLPYDTSALEPVMSRQTLELHHGKHHKSYVDRLNSLIGGTELESRSLRDIILSTAADPVKTKVFNNAAQAWNHDFFWRCLTPKKDRPPAELCRRVEESFGSFADMERRFGEAAIAVFGSGWAWLVEDGEKLRIVETSNSDNPMVLGMNALLTLDVWEHAYYVDYQNRREEYVHAVLSERINWAFATENLGRASA